MERKLGEAGSLTEMELEKTLSGVSAWHGKDIYYRPIFGGFSNTNWRVRLAGEESTFFVKMPGPGTEKFIDRTASLEASRRAYTLGIGPRPYDYLSDRGVEICDFVEGSRPCTLRDFHVPEIRNRTIELYRTFNNSAPLALSKTVFDMIEEHIKQLRELGGVLSHDFQSLYNQCLRARSALEASGLDIVPCYNDPAPANFLINDAGKITIVDFEYASNNDRCCDLATWCGEMFLSDAQQDEAIEQYFGKVDAALRSRMFIYRMLGDFKWSLWAMIQMKISTIDFDFYKFGMWKLMRLRSAIGDPRWNKALASL
ncbi:choline/ethanolamine kinase family protein [Mesorhizobium sp. BAC0120]|uniref:choline/ethanolamine kinase family protein n=1 Tax=Mesorhizobium sp. BAC0120 TaxID=3090670 RepID=UPI00298C41B9|nr:choline/ethanolamine kinase family protein [Mesorhizobium sp. BAC0120]MDW6021110.1 choline/ethanolamine kinase family protein [Mesorhizobium sp. BAC0120]